MGSHVCFSLSIYSYVLSSEHYRFCVPGFLDDSHGFLKLQVFGSEEDSVQAVKVVVDLPQVGLEGIRGHVRCLREQGRDRSGQGLTIPEGARQRPLAQPDGRHVIPGKGD
jgi:hypothetical protein